MIGDSFIETERLILRAVESSDAPILAACNNDPVVRASFFTHTPTSVERQRERVDTFYQPGSDFIPFIVEVREGRQPIGMTALHRVDLVSRAAIFSICFCDGSCRGKGYAKEVTNVMLEYSFEVLNLHRIQLHVWVGNTAAVRTYEKVGFKHEGRLREAMKHNGVYCDFFVMGILEEEWRALRSDD
ncbi:MAG: GNAT family N-acetyltransferase [Candidatus Sumerlaeia bacterium]|nr:GNAT family N-acetyltransferase [Candidatus Sumerlaeia bacterium]